MPTTCSLILYDFRVKNPTKDTRFPVHLRVIFKMFPKTYSLRLSLTRKEFEQLIRAKQIRQEYQHAYHFLNKATEIIRDLKEEFTWQEFENRYFAKNENGRPADLFDSLAEYAEKVRLEGRIKTFQSLQNTIKRLKGFHKGKRLPMHLVTSEWLSAFDASLREAGLRVSSVGIHARNIRTVFNWEISKGRLKQDFYPFGRNRYIPPSATRVKKALSYEEVMKIFNYEPSHPTESWARDMWIFSYLGNGMNIKDLALLRYENIVGEEIHFVRAKTLRKTMDNQRMIHDFLHPHMREIMSRWGKQEPLPQSFIFDIMEEGVTDPEQECRNVNQAVKTINKYMKRIGQKLEFTKLPTCNFARHTYSTVLKRANVPIAAISEALGHFPVKTTEIYLDSFESETRAEIAKHLL